MSPKKITDADKLEIVDLYRQSGETTTSLALRYGVSNSTISRLLKTIVPEAEYELLIQQKRGSKGSNEEDGSSITAEPPLQTSIPAVEFGSNQPQQLDSHDRSEQENSVLVAVADEPTIIPTDAEINYGTNNIRSTENDPIVSTFQAQHSSLVTPPPISSMTEDRSAYNRRVRRRSSALSDDAVDITPELQIPADEIASPTQVSCSESEPTIDLPTLSAQMELPSADKKIGLPPVSRVPVLRELRIKPEDRRELEDISSSDEISEDESDEDGEDVSALAAMFGEEISSGEEEEEFTEEEDWEEEPASVDRDRLLTSGLQIQVTPLSQATLPRTCYIVIDKFAELIVRPLKDFAELGQIPGEEIQQRTLPIFDNHRVAKRFSNQRTQRVIKVPDSRVFQKTTQHL